MRTIKILLHLRFVALVSAGIVTASAQTNTALVGDIRNEFKNINTDSSLQKTVMENDALPGPQPDGGQKLTGFYKGTQLKKMVYWVGVSNGYYVTEYYYKDNQLIFLYDQFNAFVYDDVKNAMRYDTTTRTAEGRFYFSANKLIDKKTTGSSRYEDGKTTPEKQMLQEAADNKKLLEKWRLKHH